MYPITNEAKALFEAEQRKVLRITGTDRNGATITITDDNVIEDSFQIDRYSCNSEKLEIGTAVAAQMSLKLENGDRRYNSIVFEGAELFAEIGITDWESMTLQPWTDNNGNPITDNNGNTIYFFAGTVPMSWVPLGLFTPDVQPRRMTTISLTCLDRMTRFDKIVDATVLNFPMTVAELVGLVCAICNVPITQNISGLTNANVILTGLPSIQQVITYRNLIQWCAGIMATNAWIDWNGELRLSWYNNTTDYESTINNRYSSDLYENDLIITGAKYTNINGATIVSGTDDYAIDLTGNYLAANQIATILPAINTALNGFTYRPFTAAVVAAPYLWPMDAIVFTDKDDNSVNTVLTNVVFGLNGTTALKSNGMTYAVDQLAEPTGMTKDQAQIVEQVAHSVESLDDSLTQQEIFNRLTDNGAAQGLIMYNGQLYINASYINAGSLNVSYINFNEPGTHYDVPNENDPSTLLDGQSVSGGWIVNTSGDGYIKLIQCDYAIPLRGMTVSVTFTYNVWRDGSQTMENDGIDYWTYITSDATKQQVFSGWFHIPETQNPFTHQFTVPNDANAFWIQVNCTGVKQISVTLSGTVVPTDAIKFTYAGLDVGMFLLDRDGNIITEGASIFKGAASFVKARITNAIISELNGYSIRGVKTIGLNADVITINSDTCASGSFETADGKTVTVTNGLITDIT